MKEAEVSTQKFERLADFLHENNWLLSQKSDDLKIQYEEFLESAVRSKKNHFNHLNMFADCIDKFHGVFLVWENQFERLWFACKFVFILSHGQSQIKLKETLISIKIYWLSTRSKIL